MPHHPATPLEGCSPGKPDHIGERIQSTFPIDHTRVMRFVQTMSMVMADQLRTLIFHSMDVFVNFWRQYDFEEMTAQAFGGE